MFIFHIVIFIHPFRNRPSKKKAKEPEPEKETIEVTKANARQTLQECEDDEKEEEEQKAYEARSQPPPRRNTSKGRNKEEDEEIMARFPGGQVGCASNSCQFIVIICSASSVQK